MKAAEVAKNLSAQAREVLIALFIAQGHVDLAEDYGIVVTELIVAKVLRCDWNILHHKSVFVLQRTGRHVVEAIKKTLTLADCSPDGKPACAHCGRKLPKPTPIEVHTDAIVAHCIGKNGCGLMTPFPRTKE